MPYRIVWTIMVFFGAITQLDLAWMIADVLNALMAIPNLVALLALSPVVIQLTRAGLDRALRD
jgi:AGCS family alanine or glycine:cation symporter